MLEIAVSNITAALAAQQAGADRIELCDNLCEGGTTPSYGYLQQARKLLTIAVYPIIRPRGGDFLYSEPEFAAMEADVRICKQLGFDGVVIGLLLPNGSIDINRTRKLVELAWPMGVTFHRAFDRVADAHTALEAVIETGCERILTSGGVPHAPEGAAAIKELVQLAGDRITIMPGSGVRAANLEALAQATGAAEFHSSAKTTVGSQMQYHNAALGANDGLYDGVDEKEITEMKKILTGLTI